MGMGRWVVLAVTALLAACQVVPKNSPGPIVKPPEEGPVTGQLPTDATRHRIALLVPLTSANAGVGESIANAANMASSHIRRVFRTAYPSSSSSF